MLPLFFTILITIVAIGLIVHLIARRRRVREQRQELFSELAKLHGLDFKHIESGLPWKLVEDGYARNIMSGTYKGHTIEVSDIYRTQFGSIQYSYVGTKILCDNQDIDASNDVYIKVEPAESLERIDSYLKTK